MKRIDQPFIPPIYTLPASKVWYVELVFEKYGADMQAKDITKGREKAQ